MATRGGKRPGSGRKSKAEELGLSGLLDSVWPIADRRAVISVLHKRAMDGNEKAAALLLAYAYGKPTERHELSNPDGSPLVQPVADAVLKIYGAPKSNSE